MTPVPDTSPFTLGPWQVDPQLDTLHDGQRSVKLEPRTMRLLCTLAQAQGSLARTETLRDTVWP